MHVGTSVNESRQEVNKNQAMEQEAARKTRTLEHSIA